MPRANGHFLPGYFWQLTDCCHQKAFLLNFARDRRRYLRWIFEIDLVTIHASDLWLEKHAADRASHPKRKPTGEYLIQTA